MTEAKEDKKVGLEEEKSVESKESKQAIQLRKHRPLSMFGRFDRIFDELDNYFRDFWKPSRFWNFEPFPLRTLDEDKFFRTPLTNIAENDENYSITAELPGLDKGDIEIAIHDGVLEIKGEQKEEHEEKKDGFVRREYHSSSYHRSFTIPENIDEDNIDAKLDNGILTIALPKKELEQKEKKKIEVK